MLPSSGLPSHAVLTATAHLAGLHLLDTLPAGVIGAVLACFAIALVVVSVRRHEH